MAVKDYIEERAVEIAGYIVETKATVRQAAKKFGISKSPEEVPAAVRLVVPAEAWISAVFSDSDRRKRAKP